LEKNENRNKTEEITALNTIRKELFSELPDRPWSPSPSLLFNEYQGSLPEIQRLRPEADHLHPSSANVKNEWSYTSTPPINLHGTDRYFISHRKYVKTNTQRK